MSITVAFLAPHTGRHAAAAALPLAALASRFLRWARPRTAEGGRADPAPARGAALLQPESAQLSDAELAELDAKLDAVLSRPVNGRNLGTQPRQQLPERVWRPGKQPWPTMGMPLLYEPEPDGPSYAWDPGDGLGPSVPIARPYTAPARTFYACCEHCEGQDHPPAFHGLHCSDGCNGVPEMLP